MDYKKFICLVLYLCNSHKFTRTQLNKMCFFADALHFLSSGMVLSNVKYLKMQYGPVPENVDLVRSWLIKKNYLIEMTKIDSASITYSYEFNHSEQIFNQVKSTFNETEIKTIDAVLQFIGGKSATELSRLSHTYNAWQSARWNDYIDFNNLVNDPCAEALLLALKK